MKRWYIRRTTISDSGGAGGSGRFVRAMGCGARNGEQAARDGERAEERVRRGSARRRRWIHAVHAAVQCNMLQQAVEQVHGSECERRGDGRAVGQVRAANACRQARESAGSRRGGALRARSAFCRCNNVAAADAGMWCNGCSRVGRCVASAQTGAQHAQRARRACGTPRWRAPQHNEDCTDSRWAQCGASTRC